MALLGSVKQYQCQQIHSKRQRTCKLWMSQKGAMNGQARFAAGRVFFVVKRFTRSKYDSICSSLDCSLLGFSQETLHMCVNASKIDFKVVSTVRPVWITVHPISITFTKSVFGTFLRRFSFGLGKLQKALTKHFLHLLPRFDGKFCFGLVGLALVWPWPRLLSPPVASAASP